MKELIRKILREVEEDQKRIQRSYQGSPEDRLRIVLNQMKSIKGWESFVQDTDKYKRIPGYINTKRQGLLNILKYLGVNTDSGRYSEEAEMTYWFAKVFMVNGGYDRDFTEGPIQLINLPVYDMAIDYTEEVFEYRTGWGTLVGAIDEKEAIEYFESDPGNYINDSDTHDSDYGEITDVDNTQVEETRWLKFKPEWVGL